MKKSAYFLFKALHAFILLHTLFAAVNAQDLPPPPFWHFSVLTGDKSSVVVMNYVLPQIFRTDLHITAIQSL